MYERILTINPPSQGEIENTLGSASVLLQRFEDFLQCNYEIQRELKYPFGKAYGWGYKYSHKTVHLCYVFFESGAVTVTLQLGDKAVPAVEAVLPGMLPKTRQLWNERYPCGKSGGWVHYRVLDSAELTDIIELIKIKKLVKR